MNNSISTFQKIFLNGWNPYFWIIGIGFIVYAQVLFFGFTYLDDNVIILNNQAFFQNPQSIIQIFKQPDLISPQFYRPVLHLLFALESQISHSSPFLFHLTTLLIHLIAASLVFVLLSELNYRKDLSLFFSIVFAVHPVLTQSVAWIPGRTDSLWSLFGILSFVFFIKALKTPRLKFVASHLFFFILALLSKETAVALPLIFIFYILLIHRDKKITTPIGFALSWFVITTLWFALRKIIVGSMIGGVSFSQVIQSIIAHIPALFSYVGKAIFPFGLSVLPYIQDLFLSVVFGFIAFGITSVLLVISKEKRFSRIIFGVFWFIFLLLPSFIMSKIVHESRVYLPIIGLFIILLEIDAIKKINFFEKSMPIVALAIILIFAIVAFLYSQTFKEPLRFWENAVKTSPHSPLAHLNLGVIYFFNMKFLESEQEYKQALQLNPFEYMVHNNLGFLYYTQKRYEEAEKEYKQEITINPRYNATYQNLGLLYYAKGDIETARKFWQYTLLLNPGNTDARKMLINTSNNQNPANLNW